MGRMNAIETVLQNVCTKTSLILKCPHVSLFFIVAVVLLLLLTFDRVIHSFHSDNTFRRTSQEEGCRFLSICASNVK